MQHQSHSGQINYKKKKRTDGKSDGKLCSVENSEIQPVVEERIEDIGSQLLGLGDED